MMQDTAAIGKTFRLVFMVYDSSGQVGAKELLQGSKQHPFKVLVG
jgi:hypothetical protein